MTPRTWSSVLIDPSEYPMLCAEVEAHEGDNPACHLGPYWRERRGPEMHRSIAARPALPHGFVGDGWPLKANQDWVLSRDRLNLARAYHPDDLHTRDAGDAIYQANVLIPEMEQRREPGRLHTEVVDLGAGYGRLAVPFAEHYEGRLTYYGVDYAPIGLLTLPQFVRQTLGTSRARIVSLPAWALDEVEPASVHLVVSVHSLQEMEPPTIRFYLDWTAKGAAPGALFYSVNLMEETWKPMIPATWRLVWERPVVANRDGPFREALWEIVP